MSDHKFKNFIKSRKWSGAEDNFVQHVQGEYTLPDVKSWDDIAAYLEDNQAHEDVFRSAKYIWELYVADNDDQKG